MLFTQQYKMCFGREKKFLMDNYIKCKMYTAFQTNEQFQTNQDRDEMHLVALLNWCSVQKWEDMKQEGRLCQQCCIEEVREALEAMLRESNLSSLI